MTNFFKTPALPQAVIAHPAASRPPVPSFDSTRSCSPSPVFGTPEAQASSADTSLLTDNEEESQDLFPTQDAVDVLDDERVSRSLNEAFRDASRPPKTFPERLRDILDFSAHRLPTHLPFEVLYEIHSLSASWKMTPSEVFKALERKCGKQLLDAEKRWQAIKLLAHNNGPHHLAGLNAWCPNEGASAEQSQHKATYLTATLHWAEATDEDLFKVQLNGPMVDKSCRFHRFYGSTRFMILNVPYTRKHNIPKHLQPRQDDHQQIHEAVNDWLVSGQLSVAGRMWKPFWVEPNDNKEDRFSKVHLFAVSGTGLDLNNEPYSLKPISMAQFIDWHTPVAHNLNSSDLKLFARYKLGLSKTIPTVVLERTEIFQVDDKRGTDKVHVMDDGAALMSRGLADAIAAMLDLEVTPSALQGRIGGCKGLWMVDWEEEHRHDTDSGYWIEVSEAQLKVKPHPASRDACDVLRTFEVTKVSHSTPPAALNAQLITVLSDRGVPRSVLENKMQQWTHTYFDDLEHALGDTCKIRSWLQNYHSTFRDDTIPFEGSLPWDKTDKLNMLLDAGFEPTTSSHLHEMFRDRMLDYLNWWVEKVRIAVPQSTYVYCIPDPYGVLEPGEAHFGFSEPRLDQPKGFNPWYLAGVDGLVARNPANLPSDIQRVKFVHHPKLDKFKDVIIFSTKGNRPLADLLSGGDYDGDEAFVCWDQDIVTRFSNYPGGPPDDIKAEDCGLVLRSRPLGVIFPGGKVTPEALNDYMSRCLDFNMVMTQLGSCTNEHQRLVYAKSLKERRFDALQDAGALLLAKLAGFLVDAPKQGYELSEENWTRIKIQARGQRDLPVPAFKKPETDVNEDFSRANIMDFLRFLVARPEKDRILRQWKGHMPQTSRWEAVLAQPFVDIQNLATECTKNGDASLQEIIDQLKINIDSIIQSWATGMSQSKKDINAYRQRVAAAYEQFTAIRPLASAQNQPYFKMMLMAPGYWELIRASCYYCHSYDKKATLMWFMTGEELCQMKARSLGRARYMTAKMYSSTKMDTRAIKRRGEDADDIWQGSAQFVSSSN